MCLRQETENWIQQQVLISIKRLVPGFQHITAKQLFLVVKSVYGMVILYQSLVVNGQLPAQSLNNAPYLDVKIKSLWIVVGTVTHSVIALEIFEMGKTRSNAHSFVDFNFKLPSCEINKRTETRYVSNYTYVILLLCGAFDPYHF